MIYKIEVNGKYKELKRIGELTPLFYNCKSFYGKAYILEDEENNKYLLSYNTVVSIVKNGIVEHFGKYSQTTSRHQKEFEYQFAY